MNVAKYSHLYRKMLSISFVCCSAMLWAQSEPNYRAKTIAWPTEVVQLDSMIIAPTSLVVVAEDTLDQSQYSLSYDGRLSMLNESSSDSLKLSYRVLPLRYEESYSRKDSSIIRPEFNYEDPFAYKPSKADQRTSIIDLEGFDKRGSISRGVQVGNAQDLSVNSDLNLQLSGKVSDKISLLANISDDNIPIQADGSTQQLQEFDQVFVKLFTDKSSLIAGDYALSNRPRSYFNRYRKKARGARFDTRWDLSDQDSTARIDLRAAAAISRGKFARNIIPGVEGNQGPYKLRGADGELYVIVLSGTERVYIDGRLLKRGKEYDYTIDYNAAELVFTANQLITKDKRIVAEFQFTEQSYARSLVNLGVNLNKEQWSAYIDLYSEQDAKRQSLQQSLDATDRAFLSELGDNIDQALVTRYDTVAFSQDAVLYALRDSLGYDSVFVQSDDPSQSLYNVNFSRVGSGLGDYVEAGFTASGKVFRWLSPDTVAGELVHRGDYIHGLLLVTPKQRQMAAAGLRYAASSETWVSLDAALSQEDINTFSSQDAADDIGSSFRIRAQHVIKLDSTASLSASTWVEHTAQSFNYLERYREVEFERNWNLSEADLLGDQLLSNVALTYNNKVNQNVTYAFSRLSTTADYLGLDHALKVRWDGGPWRLRATGSYLNTSGSQRSEFSRHSADISRTLGAVRLGFTDLREENIFRDTSSSFGSRSYRWYQWEGYLSSADTSTWNYRLYFRDRYDWSPSSESLRASAQAREYGVQLSNGRHAKHQLKTVISWRELSITRPELISSSPEETFLGRLEYNARWLKDVINSRTFYELGSGLEREREFVYIEVPAGQGAYVWVDYNGDGVRDLEEFENAQFQYEANFIRVFTPTDEFEKTFTNQVAQSLSIDPAKIWRTEKGLKRFVARCSSQASWRADRKTSNEEGLSAFNPLVQDLQDSVLLSLNNSLRHSFFFNKTDPVWSVDHNYTDVKNKQLLTNGSESRATKKQLVNARYTIARKYTMRLTVAQSTQSREASYSATRDFAITEQSLSPSLEWQPGREFRLSMRAEWTEKENQLGELEIASIAKTGVEARWTQLGKGSLNMTLDQVRIVYDGEANSSLAFEMLDGLRPGDNYTWSLYAQRNLAKNLQLDLSYNGRKSEDGPVIHAGGIQIRAFF